MALPNNLELLNKIDNLNRQVNLEFGCLLCWNSFLWAFIEDITNRQLTVEKLFGPIFLNHGLTSFNKIKLILAGIFTFSKQIVDYRYLIRKDVADLHARLSLVLPSDEELDSLTRKIISHLNHCLGCFRKRVGILDQENEIPRLLVQDYSTSEDESSMLDVEEIGMEYEKDSDESGYFSSIDSS